jgi:hypothetical protein
VLAEALGDPGATGATGAADGVAAVRRRRDRVARARHLPRLVAAARGRAPVPDGVAEYARSVTAVYRAVADAAGARIVVDSSKHPADALTLALAGVELAVLHVVRDPRAVAASWSAGAGAAGAGGGAPPRHGALWSGAWWTVFNAATEWGVAGAAGVTVHRVRHEDLVAAPVPTLSAAAAALGLPDGPWPMVGAGGHPAPTVELAPAHLVAGNPMRFVTGPVALSDEGRRPLDAGRRLVATVGALPLLTHYGYSVMGERSR